MRTAEHGQVITVLGRTNAVASFNELWRVFNWRVRVTDHIRCEFEMMSPHPWTRDLQETNCVYSNGFQMNQSVLRLSAKTIETEHWVEALRPILSWDFMCHNVMLMDSTHRCRLAWTPDTLLTCDGLTKELQTAETLGWLNIHFILCQCHGSTGYCWCVDSNGQERAGTRTPPGTQPTDCDGPGESAFHGGRNLSRRGSRMT